VFDGGHKATFSPLYINEINPGKMNSIAKIKNVNELSIISS
jgi:hypothetical protein